MHMAERITITIPDTTAEQVERIMQKKNWNNKSAFIVECIRQGMPKIKRGLV